MPKAPGPLIAGCVIGCVAAGIFVAIATNALMDGPLVDLDHRIAQDMIDASSGQPTLRTIMVGVTHSGGTAAMAVLTALGVIWEGWRGLGKWRVAVGWALIMIGGALLNRAVKEYCHRERPPIERRDSAAPETSKSFPSGHAMGSTIGVGLLGYALMLRTWRLRTKLLIVLVLGAWVLSIGFSRIYLRAHWFSDVLGGFALGAAWLSVGLGILETWRRNAERPASITNHHAHTSPKC
jgi:membrane-associated phospholipid phosphatase